jgi:hypothetical protein
MVQAQEYFDKIFRLMHNITDLSSLQHIFHNVVLYLTILHEVTPTNLEKVETLGTTCLKRAQSTGNELVLVHVYLTLSTLTTHLVSTSSLARVGSDLEMVRSASMTNLSHFQQIQQRNLLAVKHEGVKDSNEAPDSTAKTYVTN